jgi:hypothetical protein
VTVEHQLSVKSHGGLPRASELTLMASRVVSKRVRVWSENQSAVSKGMKVLTLSSDNSECRCVCAATCSRPKRTPLDSSQSSPLQHCSLTSITARRVLVSLARSPCSGEERERKVYDGFTTGEVDGMAFEEPEKMEDDEAAIEAGEEGEKTEK